MITPNEMIEVLNYSAFKDYSFRQKEELKSLLAKSDLSLGQVAVLFSDDKGRLIPDLVKKSFNDDQAAKEELDNILQKANESSNSRDSPPIKNLIGDLELNNQNIVNDVQALVQHYINKMENPIDGSFSFDQSLTLDLVGDNYQEMELAKFSEEEKEKDDSSDSNASSILPRSKHGFFTHNKNSSSSSRIEPLSNSKLANRTVSPENDEQQTNDAGSTSTRKNH